MLVLITEAGEYLQEWLCDHKPVAREWVAGHVNVQGLVEYDVHLTVRTIGLALRNSVITDAAVFLINNQSLLVLLHRPDLSALQQLTGVFCAAMGQVPFISSRIIAEPDHIMLGRLSDPDTWHELEKLGLRGGWRGPPIIYGFDEAVERLQRLTSMAGTAFLTFGHRHRRMRPKPCALGVSRDRMLLDTMKAGLGPAWHNMLAYSGVRAAELYVAHTPDLLIIDADLPDLDCDRLLAALTRLDGNCVIFGTNDTVENAKEKWKNSGARGVINWPPDPDIIRKLGQMAIADTAAYTPPGQRAHAGG